MRKGQINRVFMYIFSIIVIVFAAYLVGNFVFTFSSDTDERAQIEFYKTLERDYDSVYRSFGSQKIYDYRLSNSITQVCFVAQNTCTSSLSLPENNLYSEINTIVSTGDNVILLERDNIDSSRSIGEFNFPDSQSQCQCINLSNSRFSLIMENSNNEVIFNKN